MLIDQEPDEKTMDWEESAMKKRDEFDEEVEPQSDHDEKTSNMGRCWYCPECLQYARTKQRQRAMQVYQDINDSALIDVDSAKAMGENDYV